MALGLEPLGRRAKAMEAGAQGSPEGTHVPSGPGGRSRGIGMEGSQVHMAQTLPGRNSLNGAVCYSVDDKCVLGLTP